MSARRSAAVVAGVVTVAALKVGMLVVVVVAPKAVDMLAVGIEAVMVLNL